MTAAPDFAALRAERNRRVQELHQRLADEHGVPMGALHTTHDPNACYCACSAGGPCEHRWDGEPYESGILSTKTCSRCGLTAFSHSMRTAPWSTT